MSKDKDTEEVDTDVSHAVQPGGPWQPDPGAIWGRIDTSAGEAGAHLHKINPYAFGVSEDGTIGRGAEVDGPASPEDIVLQPSPVGSGVPDPGQTPDGAPVGAQFAPPAGTVDTTGPEGVHHEDFDPVAIPHTEGAEPNDANVDPALIAGAPEGAKSEGDVVADAAAQKALEDKDYDNESIHNDHLKGELSKRNLGVGGARAALVKRLKDDDKQSAKSDKATTAAVPGTESDKTAVKGAATAEAEGGGKAPGGNSADTTNKS